MSAFLFCRRCCASRFHSELSHSFRPFSRPAKPPGTTQLRRSRWLVYSTSALLLATAGVVAFQTSQPFRHTTHAIVRCSRVVGWSITFSRLFWSLAHIALIEGAAVLGVADYKWTFAQDYRSDEERRQAYSLCHKRNALRVRHALLTNGGKCRLVGNMPVQCINLEQVCSLKWDNIWPRCTCCRWNGLAQ